MSKSDRPRIDIDGRNLALDEGTGVATYARNLSYGLNALGCEVGVLYGRALGRTRDPLLQEIRFFDPLVKKEAAWQQDLRHSLRAGLGGGRVSAIEVPITGTVIRGDFQHQLPRYDRIWNVHELFQLAVTHFDIFGSALTVRLPRPPQVMHWTYPMPLRVAGAKNIYTLHDLVPLRLPHTTLDKKKRYLKLAKLIASTADHLVTVSEASKRDIMELLGVGEDRITNCYQPSHIPPELLARNAEAVASQIGGLLGLRHRGYFMFFGAIEPKKNVDRLLQAFLAANVSEPLVLVGRKAWKSTRQLRLLELEDPRIRHVDYLPFPLLVSLIQGARGVIFPSLYEGFGLPVLEAMQCGTPVIASNASSLPEVAGNAALLVDPYNPSELSQAIRTLSGDGDLAERLAREGLRQARQFTPEAYQGRLRTLYRRLGVPV